MPLTLIKKYCEIVTFPRISIVIIRVYMAIQARQLTQNCTTRSDLLVTALTNQHFSTSTESQQLRDRLEFLPFTSMLFVTHKYSYINLPGKNTSALVIYYANGILY